MTTYSGPAVLILTDGARVTGMASLKTNNHGGRKGWTGSFRPDAIRGQYDRVEASQLELPYDRIADVTVTGSRTLLATQVLLSLVGTGEAPF